MLVVVVAVGCGTRKTQTRAERPAEPGTKPASEPALPPVIKLVQLEWSTEPASPRADPPTTKVYLAVTDETGKQTSYPLGVFQGSCANQGPAAAYRAVTVIQCSWAGTGIQLHAVVGSGEVLVYSMEVLEGIEPDPMARKQVQRVEIPIDAKVSVGG